MIIFFVFVFMESEGHNWKRGQRDYSKSSREAPLTARMFTRSEAAGP